MRYVLRARVFVSLAAVSLLGLAPLSRAQPDALTLEESLRLAAERSQQLLAEDAAAKAAREMAVAAGEAPDPTLTLGIANLPVDGADRFDIERDFMTMRSIGLMRELTRADKRQARAARYMREAEAAEAARTVALADLERGAAQSWLERYHRERARDVLERQRADAALQVEAADLAFRSGAGPESDVFAARSTVAEIDDRIAENARDLEAATLRLARWIGDAARRPLAAPPPLDVVALDGAQLETTLLHHPQLALLARREEIARAEAEIARANRRSDWTVAVMYGERGPDFSDMISINVSKPLQWRERNRQDRELAASLAAAESMHAAREEQIRAHVAEVREVLARWQANRARLSRYATTLVPLAAERARAATAAYRAGRGALEQVLDARIAEVDTRLDQLMLELETAQLWAYLHYLVPAEAGLEAS